MAGKSVAVMDVRSSEIAIFVGEMGVNRTFVFKASKTEPYGGYQDGEFFNMDEFSDAVSRALTAVEQICGKKIKVLYIGVPGEFMQVIPKEQVLSFPKRIKIGAKEVGLLHNSGAEKLEGYKLIRSTSMIYTTSDNRRVANPIGMYSTGLSGILSYFYCTDYFIDAMKQTFKDQKISLFYLPTDFAMAMHLLTPEQRDEYAIFLDVGYLSSTISILWGNGVLAQRTFWVGQGQIAVRLMEKFRLPYEAAVSLLTKSNLYLKHDAKNREIALKGRYYEIPTDQLIEEIKDGLDEICEQVSLFLEDCAGSELDMKPIYVSGEGLDGIRGALEHISRRLSAVCELVAPELPYYNKPSMSSRIALIDMACEDNRKGGSFYKV